jgi:hypothetical protein
MGDRYRPLRIFDNEGLRVFEMALALSGVAIVAYGALPFQPLDDIFLEDIRDQTHLAVRDQ